MTHTIKTIFSLAETEDEYNPVSGSLDDVAALLMEGVWNTDDEEDDERELLVPPAQEGQHFTLYRRTYVYVPCERMAGSQNIYIIPDELPGEIHSWAFYDGSGWTSEMCVSTGKEADDFISAYGTDPVEYLVCLKEVETETLVMTDGALLPLATEPEGAA